VLDPAPAKHKRFRDDVLRVLELKDRGSPRDVVMDAIRRAGIDGTSASVLSAGRVVAPELTQTALEELIDAGTAVRIGEALYDRDVLQQTAVEVQRLGEAHQRAHPLAWGIGRAELQERLGHAASRARFNELLEWLAQNGDAVGGIYLRSQAVRVGSAERQLDASDRAALVRLEACLQNGGASPPTVSELQKKESLGARFAAFVSLLEEHGAVVRVTESLLYHRDALAQIDAKLREFLADRDVMSMAEFKALAGVSRKYAVPLLEYFDRQGITARAGDVRKPGPAL
jgi:selenocysteine-specific elongation factor